MSKVMCTVLSKILEQYTGLIFYLTAYLEKIKLRIEK